MKRKKSIWISLIIVLLLLAIVGGIFVVKNLNEKKKGKEDIIVKNNVHTITGENERENALEEVSENQLVFEKDPKYKEGDIIVAGIIDEAGNGFIRKVIKTEKKEDKYVVETESAVLTDVFEKAHIVKRMKLTDNAVEEDNSNATQAAAACVPQKLQRVSYNKTQENSTYSVVKLSDTKGQEDEKEYLFNVSIEENIDDITAIRGEAGFSVWVELQLDIDHGEIVFGIVVYNEAGASLQLECSEKLQKEMERVVFQKRLPRYQFAVAGVPIVVTNEIETVVGAAAEMEGLIGIKFNSSCENVYGFVYDSRKGKVSEIKENKYDTSGLNWNTTVQATGTGTADVSVHLVTKLYGSTGADIGLGVQGKATGEVKLSAKPELGGYAGRLELSIAPKVEGALVVEIPIIDEKLTEQPLFAKEFKPFWQKEWKSSNDWKKDLEWTGTGENGKTYITRFGEVNAVTCPKFQFDIPNGWDVTTEEVGTGTDFISENVVISNNRGAKVSYWNCTGRLGGASRILLKATITKAADSEFVPGYPAGTDTDYSHLGKFVVAKVKIIGKLSMDTDSDYTEADGAIFYAVVPETYLGEREFVGQAGNIDEFSFEYPTPCAFIAEAPEAKFTEKEEKEVIKILQSFRVAE